MKARQEKILVADGDRALIPQVLVNAVIVHVEFEAVKKPNPRNSFGNVSQLEAL
jgi:hypothetical protein